jgi:hypothetical protein
VADEASGGSHKILIRQALLLRLDSQFSLSLLAVGTPATIHPMAVAEEGRWSQAQTSIGWVSLIGCLACSVERRADDVISDDDPGLEEESRDLFVVIQQNRRPSQGYWYWRDKPVMEQAVAREILTQAGLELSELRSRDAGEDPPDCEATINGQHCGIEVTELLHRRALERSLKSVRERNLGKEPARSEAHFGWERNDLLSELQRIIDRKDQPEKLKGGPYDRYLLVIVTAEMFLYRDAVARFISGAAFQATMITDVLLGLDYHPDPEAGGGSCPVFRLPIEPRR